MENCIDPVLHEKTPLCNHLAEAHSIIMQLVRIMRSPDVFSHCTAGLLNSEFKTTFPSGVLIASAAQHSVLETVKVSFPLLYPFSLLCGAVGQLYQRYFPHILSQIETTRDYISTVFRRQTGTTTADSKVR
jgi:hypothetical protein